MYIYVSYLLTLDLELSGSHHGTHTHGKLLKAVCSGSPCQLTRPNSGTDTLFVWTGALSPCLRPPLEFWEARAACIHNRSLKAPLLPPCSPLLPQLHHQESSRSKLDRWEKERSRKEDLSLSRSTGSPSAPQLATVTSVKREAAAASSLECNNKHCYS